MMNCRFCLTPAISVIIGLMMTRMRTMRIRRIIRAMRMRRMRRMMRVCVVYLVTLMAISLTQSDTIPPQSPGTLHSGRRCPDPFCLQTFPAEWPESTPGSMPTKVPNPKRWLVFSTRKQQEQTLFFGGLNIFPSDTGSWWYIVQYGRILYWLVWPPRKIFQC
jgi:hypothetical protein